MESPQPVLETPAKKNQTPLIIAAVVIVLCCCCVVLAVAGYYSFVTVRSSQITSPQPVEEAVPVLPTDAPTLEPGFSSGEAPSGGLGNDILRNDTWQYVAAVALGRGCDQPVGADTKIVVLQQPQNGVWVEQWTVACTSGKTYPFEITFTLDATEATFHVKALP